MLKNKQLINAKQASEILGISESGIRKKIERKELHPVPCPCGHGRLLRKSDIDVLKSLKS